MDLHGDTPLSAPCARPHAPPSALQRSQRCDRPGRLSPLARVVSARRHSPAQESAASSAMASKKKWHHEHSVVDQIRHVLVAAVDVEPATDTASPTLAAKSARFAHPSSREALPHIPQQCAPESSSSDRQRRRRTQHSGPEQPAIPRRPCSSSSVSSSLSRTVKPLSPPISSHDVIASAAESMASSFSHHDSRKLPELRTKDSRNPVDLELQSRLEAFETKEVKMKASLNQIQGKLQQVEHLADKYKILASNIVDLERKPHGNGNELSIVQSILDFLLDKGLKETARALQVEAPSVFAAATTAPTSKRSTFAQCIASRQFKKAVFMIQEELPKHLSGGLSDSIDDLFYILNKYHLLDLCQREQFQGAVAALQVIGQHAQRELAKGGLRAQWFSEDYRMLDEFLRIGANYPQNNTYVHWDWDHELNKFWKSADGPVTNETPLYIHALNALFPYGAPNSTPNSLQCNGVEVVKLEEAMQAWEFRQAARECVESSRLFEAFPTAGMAKPSTPYARTKPPNILQSGHVLGSPKMKREQSHSARSSTPQEASGISTDKSILSDPSLIQYNPTQSAPMAVPSSRRLKPATSSYGLVPNNTMILEPSLTLVDDSRSSRGSARSMRSDIDENDKRSLPSSSFATQLSPTELERLMPAAPKVHESSEFALSTSCGPVHAFIRCVDIQPRPDERNRILAASAGDDRQVSIWDVRVGKLVSQLDNGSSNKPVMALAFNPNDDAQLLTTDMDFNAKLWNWKERRLLRCWKKHHTRVIWKVCFVPGRKHFAATCSGDYTIKVWDTTQDVPSVTCFTANEPFTSFVFCNDVDTQMLVASLSYTLRLYKMRTEKLIATVHLKELKQNKTPVTSLALHPEHSSFLLISCDNELRLFDMSSETMLMKYSTRDISPGTRVIGNFSPCGTFVYSGCCDMRSLSSITQTQRRSSISSDNTFMNDSAVSLNHLGSPHAKGVYVWRVATGKLEATDMRAMQCGEAVTACKWVKLEGSEKGQRREGKKVMLAATLHGALKLYL
ncbi:hypothetical protein BC830DRAFT_1152469 [Chytriomyces sp. MP71]|nr:hypothetical protein BC830DRAFT_1152469 [Chytriomyces sp. MP71]